MAKCQACQEREKDPRWKRKFGWDADGAELDVKIDCAFPDGGSFVSRNWNCATANMIRAVCTDHPTNVGPAVDWRAWNVHRDNGDQNYATIEVPEFDDPFSTEKEQSGAEPLALWVTWSKRRGQTDNMVLLFDNADPRPPTEDECLRIIARLRQFNRLGEMAEKELA